MKNKKIKFIALSGNQYPCLCYGTLFVEVNGETYGVVNVPWCYCGGCDCV